METNSYRAQSFATAQEEYVRKVKELLLLLLEEVVYANVDCIVAQENDFSVVQTSGTKGTLEKRGDEFHIKPEHPLAMYTYFHAEDVKGMDFSSAVPSISIQIRAG